MKSVRPLHRLQVLCAAVALVLVAIAGSKHGVPRAKAQITVTRDVFVFHCALIPNQAFQSSNLGSFNPTFTFAGNGFTSPNDCAQVWLDALNAGYQLKSALALPNGGPGGTGATKYVFVRNDQ